MKILLDTSTCIDLLRGTGGEVAARFRARKPSDLVIGSVIVAELRAGAELSRDQAEAHRRIDLLLDSVLGLPFTDEEARAFGRINADLIRRKLADHIDDMDKLIAAQAVTHGLRVATSNEKDFARIRGISWENWRTGRRG